MYDYKILDKNFVQRYTGSFYQYYISTVYGNEVITAESLIEEEENE
jgi:hypothetical protein